MKKKNYRRRQHYYDPGAKPQPRKIVGESNLSARLPQKPTRQMLRAQQRKGR
jgi:hypothetical protein